MKCVTLTVLMCCLTLVTSVSAQEKISPRHAPLTAFSADFDSLIIPTPEWISLYCENPTLNGSPLAAGDTIMVFDPDGILCGIDTVRADGKYGFLPVYRDDEFTDADEGAEPGDTLSFAVNGRPVTVETAVVWTENGDNFEICSFSSQARDVYVDIKPGSCPNPFNTRGNLERGRAVLPVALLGTESFDVANVDPSTITLAGVAAERYSYEDVATPYDRDSCDCHDEKGDGFEDLTLKFLQRDILAATAPVRDREYYELVLEAKTEDGVSLVGSDCIWILGDYGEFGDDGADSTALNPHNHPNPFNPTTTIQFSMPVSGQYTLEIFDVRGRQVASFTGTEGAGTVAVEFDAAQLASGMYLYRVTVDQWQETKKMLLLK